LGLPIDLGPSLESSDLESVLMTAMPRVRSWPGVLTAVIFTSGCAAVVRNMTDDPVAAKAEEEAQTSKEARALTRHIDPNAPLPAATMEPRAMREALWEIAARRRRGEVGLDTSDQTNAGGNTKSLEAQFLAAATIVDEDDSWKAFNKLSEDYPKFYWAHAGMAAIYSKWKVTDQCEKEVNTMLELAPDNVYTYTIRGDLFLNLGEFTQAVRDYTTALRADPSDADARVGLALAKKGLGQTTGLQAEYERALQDVPTHYGAAEQLALLLDDSTDKDAAIKAWDRVSHLAPKNRAAQLALARLRGDADPSGAILAYEKAAKQSPLSKVEQAALTKLYREQNRTDDELHSLDTLAKMDPKDPSPYRRVGEIAEGKNDMAAAETAYEAILKVSETDADALQGLGRVSEKRAQLRQAIDYYRRSKAAGSTTAGAELDRLSAACLLPSKAISGNGLTNYAVNIGDSLAKIFAKRIEDAPRLRGEMKVKIETDGDGKLISAAVTDSNVPHLKSSDPKKFTLTFPLPPPTR